MITTEQVLKSSHYAILVGAKGVLTNEQTNEMIEKYKKITTIRSRTQKVFFFSDDHCFGVMLPIMKKLNFVPISTVMPFILPNVELKTAENYIAHYCSDYKQITTVEELTDYINSFKEN